jgi:type IV pilus assembly protein PilQ
MKKNILLMICCILVLCVCSIFQPLGAQDEPKPLDKDNLLALDLKDIDLKDALKIISQASGMNIILDKDIKAKANITLKDVTWQAALDNILKTNELTSKSENNTIRVMSLATVKKEEDTVPLSTRIITLNFAKCADLQASLGKILSSRGNIQINTSTNSLIITDTPEILARVEELADTLDIRTPQVMIRAIITSIKLEETENYGSDFTISHKLNDEYGKNRSFTQSLSLPSSVFDITYGKTILPDWNFTSLLTLLSENDKVKILASPKVLTMDNQAAQIEILEQVAYQDVSRSSDGASTIETTQFKDVGIKLYVTPHITKDKFISLSIKAEQSFVAGFDDGQPRIDSRKVETNFMLKDNQTVAIGGLKRKANTVNIQKIPILGDIPYIGRAFRQEVKNTVNEELVIFITPSLTEGNILTTKDEYSLKDSSKELFGPESYKEKIILRNKAIQEALDDETFLASKGKQ